MVALIQAARYPTSEGSVQDPMVGLARAIISAIPRLTAEGEDKLHLGSIKTAAEKVRSYGATNRERRHVQFKNSISRPLSSPTLSQALAVEGTESVASSSRWSSDSYDSTSTSRSWPTETTPLVEKSSAFEFHSLLETDVRSSTVSESSLTSRPYSFF